jgi:predicted dehydrogenase/threonine dehydrogenase-like Zn-dependent dehydrogenase
MRQLFLDKRNTVVKKIAQPLLDADSILVAVHYAYISDWTNIAQLNTKEELLNNVPQKVKRVLQAVSSHAHSQEKKFTSLGYPCAGHVVAIGKNVTHFAPGDLVACADPGYTTQADLICIPSWHAVKISDRSRIKAASLTTFAAVALHGIKQAHINLGERVAVFGLGLLGQLVVQIAKLSGCFVIAFDTIPQRLELAQASGADRTFNSLNDDVQKEMALLTQRQGVDAALVTEQYDLSLAMAITRPKGRIISLGSADVRISAPTTNVSQQEIVLIPSSGKDQIPHEDLKVCLSLIEQGKLKLDQFTAEEIELPQLEKAYRRITNKVSLGMMLSYQSNTQQVMPVTSCVIEPSLPTTAVRFKPAVCDVIRVGIIGAGEFARTTLLPLISKMRNVQIKAIVDADIKNSVKVSSQFGVARACRKDDELFQDDLVDVVVIASPHAFHCDQAIKAIKHGKGVFLEKPMVTDFAQLQELSNLLKRNPTIPFCVDYSRSFSPFVQKIKQAVVNRNTPLMMQYRLNSKYHVMHQWTYSNVGAGRIIGDACQMIDLFCYLTAAKPIAVSVEAMHAARDDIFPTDNFSAHISFDDGSVGSLFFTTLGHPDMGTERFELFYDEKAILLEEYMELYGFGLPSWFNDTITSPDKGHEALLEQFFSAINQETFQSPISLERLHMVAELTLLIDQLACEGGGNKELS